MGIAYSHRRAAAPEFGKYNHDDLLFAIKKSRPNLLLGQEGNPAVPPGLTHQ